MYLLRKKLFAVLFLAVLFLLAGLNLRHTYPSLKEAALDSAAKVQAGELSAKEAVAAVEDAMTSNLQGRMNYIEGYSYLQVLMDKREFDNFRYVKDEDGFLHYSATFREDDTKAFQYALRMKRVKDYVSPSGTKVMFVVPPAKYSPRDTNLRKGLPINDPETKTVDTLFWMNRLGIDTLNLDLYFPSENLSFEDTFFRTDHHWTIPAAFEATKILVSELNRLYGVDLDPGGYYLDEDQYEKITYPDIMLGSMGRRTGVNFVGLDDFTALWPKYSLNIDRESLDDTGRASHRSGSIFETLIQPDYLTKKDSIYGDSAYSLYLNGLRTYEHIRNLDNPDGPKILMIRDSYFSPVITFLTPLCSEIDAIWSLEELDQIDIEDYIRENEFDYIIMEVYPFNINDTAFAFFEEA